MPHTSKWTCGTEAKHKGICVVECLGQRLDLGERGPVTRLIVVVRESNHTQLPKKHAMTMVNVRFYNTLAIHSRREEIRIHPARAMELPQTMQHAQDFR